jgi:hypothetical protein
VRGENQAAASGPAGERRPDLEQRCAEHRLSCSKNSKREQYTAVESVGKTEDFRSPCADALTRKKNMAEDEIHTGYKIGKGTSDLSLLAV